MHKLSINKPESGGETLFPGENGETCCTHLAARNQMLYVPAARVTLKYHLLSYMYISHIRARLRVSAGKLQHVFHHVMPLSGAEKK